jgi:hypothetical protein
VSWEGEGDAAAAGEAPAGDAAAITLYDEDGAAFRFLPVRLLREGAEFFLIAEREGEGTLHVLRREGEHVGLVRDRETLRRVSFRLEILRRAMEGEAIEGAGDPPQVLGVIHRGEVNGRSYLVAADLLDPATVVAFEASAGGLVPADDGLVAAIREQLEEPLLALEAARPQLEAASLGLRGERIEVTSPAGPRVYETAGRLFFEGRDLLFVRRPGEAASVATEVLPGGRLEPVRDEPLLGRLRAHLGSAR